MGVPQWDKLARAGESQWVKPTRDDHWQECICQLVTNEPLRLGPPADRARENSHLRLAKVGNTKQTICSFSLGSVKPRQGREVNCVRLLGRPVKKGLPDGEGTVSQNCEGHFLGLLSCDPEDPSAKYEVNGIEP